MSLSQSFAEAAAAPRAAAERAGLKTVRLWLFVVAALIFVMVIVGGATRLTESGLSITEWKPVTGVIPPLSEAAWQSAFAAYKQIPQYSQLFPDMSLSEFKSIFFWEWSHRLLARLIGAAFILPLVWFWRTGLIRGALGRQMLVPIALLALEPIVGWWMVASGLSERVEVSQYRLAAHLLIATATFGALIWIAVGLSERKREPASAVFKATAAVLALLVFCQIGF
ncbi:MAG TPA: COX15/CtaA family protein, partial [Roseiarcus sp.]|nr:COX15/CtaA family protein [Roseiarcus sp.]